MSATAWDAALEYLDRSLTAVEAALAAEDWGSLDGGQWAPPQIDAPMPHQLLPRLEALRSRAAACEHRVRTAMEARAAELSGVATRRRVAAHYTAPESGGRA